MSYKSNTPNKVLMEQARGCLSDNKLWGVGAGIAVIWFLLCLLIGLIPYLGTIIMYIISGPMILSLVYMSLSMSRNGTADFDSMVFGGFNYRVGTAIGLYFLNLLITIIGMLTFLVPFGLMFLLDNVIFYVLGTLLVIGLYIGLIIIQFGLSMSFFIIADEDSIGPLAALKKSWMITNGNKLKIFFLGCRFIGWFLLCILTLGIGYFWVMTYSIVSYAKLYDDIIGYNGLANDKSIQSMVDNSPDGIIDNKQS